MQPQYEQWLLIQNVIQKVFIFWPLKIDFNQEWINESKKKKNRKQKIMKYKNVK